VWESTHGGDCLLGEIEFGGGGGNVTRFADAVNLLVDFGTVMVSVLTGTWNGVLYARWMPGSDTCDLTETLVGLSREFLGTPTSSDTFESVTWVNWISFLVCAFMFDLLDAVVFDALGK
jgi:hypothetical protein